MGLEEYEASLGNLALVFTILLQLTPIPIVVDIINNKSVGANTAAPFLCSMLGSALWFKYAILIGFNMTMIMVNTVAMIMNTSYLVIYYLYSERKSDVHRYLMAIVAIVATAFWFVDYSGMDEEVARSRLGLLACLTSVAFTASPLVLVGHVIEIQSTEPLPLLLIVSSFFVSTLWFFYGMILKDQYIMVQNGISLLFGLVQLSLFAIYPRRRMGKVLTVPGRKRGASIRRNVSREDRVLLSPESDSAAFEAMESRKRNPASAAAHAASSH